MLIFDMMTSWSMIVVDMVMMVVMVKMVVIDGRGGQDGRLDGCVMQSCGRYTHLERSASHSAQGSG